jgi:hypothetical protein
MNFTEMVHDMHQHWVSWRKGTLSEIQIKNLYRALKMFDLDEEAAFAVSAVSQMTNSGWYLAAKAIDKESQHLLRTGQFWNYEQAIEESVSMIYHRSVKLSYLEEARIWLWDFVDLILSGTGT